MAYKPFELLEIFDILFERLGVDMLKKAAWANNYRNETR